MAGGPGSSDGDRGWRSGAAYDEVLLLGYLQERREPVQRADVLRHVFGYAKSVKSRAVDMALNRLRAKLEVDPKKPTLVCSRRGVGIWLETGKSRMASPPPVEVPTLRFGTPYMPREGDEQAVLDLMQAGWRVVTIVGPGGGGKTRLAGGGLSPRGWRGGGGALGGQCG